MNPEFLKTALAVLAGAALTFLGARIGYRRTKLERAHEKRLDWHRTAHGIILDLADRASVTVLSPDPVEVREYEATVRQFERIVAEARAYMTAEAARELRLTSVQVWHARRKAEALLREDDPPADPVNEALREIDRSISNAERYVVDGLKGLLPSESEYPLPVRVRGFLAEVRHRMVARMIRPSRTGR